MVVGSRRIPKAEFVAQLRDAGSAFLARCESDSGLIHAPSISRSRSQRGGGSYVSGLGALSVRTASSGRVCVMESDDGEHDARGIIGAGKIGSRLGRRLLAAGYRVTFGARDAAAATEKLGAIDAPIFSPADAAAGADIVLLTVPASAAHAAAAGLALRPGSTLVDCTNPMRWDGGPVWAPPAEGIQCRIPRRGIARGPRRQGVQPLRRRNPRGSQGQQSRPTHSWQEMTPTRGRRCWRLPMQSGFTVWMQGHCGTRRCWRIWLFSGFSWPEAARAGTSHSRPSAIEGGSDPGTTRWGTSHSGGQ